jgi:superfamily II DNA/RNA helicase
LHVTATPDRLDGKSIIDHAPIFEAYITDMVREGYLTNILPILVRTKTKLDQIHTTGGDYNEHELEIVIDNPARNKRIVEAYQEYAAGRPFLCFSVTVRHAENIARIFRDAGIAVEAISGSMTTEERVRTLEDFESGKLQGLVNCGILTEGYDFCPTSCIILARPTKSRALVVQKIGRGLRLAPGKSDCIVLDITDNILNHRLQPVTLSQAIGKDLRDNESLLALMAREEEEEKREAVEGDDPKERKLKQRQRGKDLVLNILQTFDWKKNEHGHYVMEIGLVKHRVALIPAKDRPGMWKVAARLAPHFEMQWWEKNPMPLNWAQNYAEGQALKIQADPAAVGLVDRNAEWRTLPVSPEQLAKLDKWHVAYPTDEDGNCTWTRGEAADAIGRKLELFKKRREAQKAKKVTA